MLALPTMVDGSVQGFLYLDSRTRAFALTKGSLARVEEAARQFGSWLAVRSRANVSPRDQRFLEMGRNGFALIHDLRNLFTLLQSKVQWLQSEPESRAETVEALKEEIRLGRGRLEEILNQGMGGESEKLDVQELIEQAIARIPFLRSGEPKIEVACSMEEKVFLRGRRGPLLDSFTNLLLNAVDATVGEGEIEVKLFRQPKEIWVRITDRGSGMGPEQMSRLFDPMRRSQKDGSVGLGLYSTKKIVESHGGSLSFHSSPHVGTAVTVVFPIHEESSLEKRILLIDDEEETAPQLAAALACVPCVIETASEERVAVAKAREGGFDLIVLDHGMPRRHGIELLTELRRRGIRVPIILMCARKININKDLEPFFCARKPLRALEFQEIVSQAFSHS